MYWQIIFWKGHTIHILTSCTHQCWFNMFHLEVQYENSVIIKITSVQFSEKGNNKWVCHQEKVQSVDYQRASTLMNSLKSKHGFLMWLNHLLNIL